MSKAPPRGRCKKCNKKMRSFSGFCKEHNNIKSPTKGKYKRSEEQRKKLSDLYKGRDAYWIKGKKHPEYSNKQWWIDHPEEREKAKKRGKIMVSDKVYIRKLSELISGDKNPNWQGGKVPENKKYIGFSRTLKKRIKERDNYTCQLCFQTETDIGSFNMCINHINFDKTDFREENLNCLCRRCNLLINFDKEKWIIYFQQKFANMTGIG